MLRESMSLGLSPRCSRISNSGTQYTPVASIATVVAPQLISHSASACRSSVNVPNVRTDSGSRSSRTDTTCPSDPASIPAASGLTKFRSPIIWRLPRRIRGRFVIKQPPQMNFCGPQRKTWAYGTLLNGIANTTRYRAASPRRLRSSGTMLGNGLLPRTTASTASSADRLTSIPVHPSFTGACRRYPARDDTYRVEFFADQVLNVSAGTLPVIVTESLVRATLKRRSTGTMSGCLSCTARRVGEGHHAGRVIALHVLLGEDVVAVLLDRAAGDERAGEPLDVEAPVERHQNLGLGAEVRARRRGHDQHVDVLLRLQPGVAQELLGVAVGRDLIRLMEQRRAERARAQVREAHHANG